ncbi:MAG: rhomboid family intramembrane serine protease [Deltaproteobacteria bacterium]|jgi:membrane associated rhomboid family serine protease|nr:rhomboid family intramembrane serine protease [Deltaproteobacteria bacterium]
MLPLKDNIPARNFPYVNIGLIVINTVFFIYQMSYGPGFERVIFTLGFIPARFLAQQGDNVLFPTGFLPVFSSMFLHANLVHLISNMWMLWIFGDNVEDCMGHGRYLMFFILCGVASVFAQAVSNPHSTIPMVGASGAISGVLGAYFLTYPHARILTLVPIVIIFYVVELPAYFFLGFWFVIQFIQGSLYSLNSEQMVGGGVAWWAHVGGFMAGVLLLYVFRCKDWQRPVEPSRRIRRWQKR